MRIKILQETYDKILAERYTKKRLIKEAVFLIEKEISVGSNLERKLSFADTSFSKKILKFLQSNEIKDANPITKVDFEDDDQKTFTVWQDTRNGSKKSKQKILKLLKYLGADLSSVKGYEVEELIGVLKKGDTSNLKVVKGDDILWGYHCDNFDGDTGSCMRHDFAQKFLKIYTSNPNQVSLLVLMNPENGKIRGRALIWQLDDGSTMMDRVYTTNKQYDTEFSNYAEEKGISKRSPTSTVTLEVKGEYEFYPYMDTLNFYDTEEGILSDDDATGDGIGLEDTHGGQSGRNWSEHHQEFINDDEGMYVDSEGDYFYYDDLVVVDDEAYLIDSDEIQMLSDWTYVKKNEAVQLRPKAGEEDDKGDWVKMDDAHGLIDDTWVSNEEDIVEMWDDDGYGLESDDEVVELFNGTYAHDDYHEIIKTYDDKITVKDNSTQLYNKQWADDDDENLVKLFDGRYAVSTDKNLITINGKYVPSNEVTKEPDGTYTSKPMSQINY